MAEQTNEEILKELADNYLDVICPYIIQYELITNHFPVPIFNEIRSTFSHLMEFYAGRGGDKAKNEEIDKIREHFKRIRRDCYKFVCEAIEEEYQNFIEVHNGIDYSVINNGEFIPELSRLRNDAIDSMAAARKKELEVDATNAKDEELLPLYEKAYSAYSDLYNYIKNVEPFANTLDKDLIKKKKSDNVSKILTWVFGLTSVAGLILTFVGFLT